MLNIHVALHAELRTLILIFLGLYQIMRSLKVHSLLCMI